MEQLEWLLLNCITILQLENTDSYYTAMWYHTSLKAPLKGASAIRILNLYRIIQPSPQSNF